MTGTSSARLRHTFLLLVIALMTATLSAQISTAAAQEEDPADSGPVPGAIGEPVPPIDSKHLYDTANLLTNDQEARIEQDANRLNGFGIPTVILVQVSDMTAEQAQAFAAEVRTTWGVESDPGADDGLVMMVVADMSEDKNVYTVMSWGDEAFPHFGIDANVAEAIHRDWLDAYVQDGEMYEGILYSLRRLIYHSIYDPAPAAPLTDVQSAARTITSWVGPLLALAGVATMVFSRSRRTPSNLERLRPYMPLILASASIIVAVAAVWSHSEVGVASTIVLLMVTAIAWVRQVPAPQPELPRGGVA